MIARLRAFFTGTAPDPAWSPTGIRRTFDGHDESRASLRFQKEQRAAAQRRAKSAKLIARQQQAEVVTFKARAK